MSLYPGPTARLSGEVEMYTIEVDNGAGYAYYQCACGAYAGSLQFLPDMSKYCIQCGKELFEQTTINNTTIEKSVLDKLADILKEVN